MRRLSPSTVLLTCLVFLTIAGWREYRVKPDGQTHVFILDIGQGDSIFIRGPRGQQMLIDGGPDSSTLTEISRRMSFFDRSIDVLALSHPHMDHIASFPAILERYRIGAVVMTGVQSETAPYREMLDMLKERQIPVMIADPAQDIDLGNQLTLDILWPPPQYAGVETTKDLNDTSVVIMLRFGDDSMLLTGDMEHIEEDELLASGEDVHADILKIGHHGSRSSTSTGFLLAVDPALAVISAGRDNQFGHPHKETLDRLQHFHIPVRVTAWEGTIDLVLDGQ